MAARNVVFLHLPAQVIPLTWVEWLFSWQGLWSASATCHMVAPDDATQRRCLMEGYREGLSVFCLLCDPTHGTWYSFQAFLTEMAFLTSAVVRVRLRADGPVTQVSAATGRKLMPHFRRTRRRTHHAALAAQEEGGKEL